MLPQFVRRQMADVVAVEQDRALSRLAEGQQQFRQRALARP
jgi:hypothetical protein